MIPTIHQILTVAGIACGCSPYDMLGESKRVKVSRARRIASTLMKETRSMTAGQVCEAVGCTRSAVWKHFDSPPNSPQMTHARSLLAKLYEDAHAMRIASFTVGEIIAAIEARQDVAVAVGCYIGEKLRRKHAVETDKMPSVRTDETAGVDPVCPLPAQP